jgi:hypothetical protein
MISHRIQMDCKAHEAAGHDQLRPKVKCMHINASHECHTSLTKLASLCFTRCLPQLSLIQGGPIKLCRMVSRVVDEWVMMRRAHCHPTKWIRQMLRTDARLFTFDSHAYISIADSCVYTDHLYMLDECPFGCLVAWCTFPPNT